MENLNNSGIYQILNNVTMKIYIGSSKQIPKRLRNHFTDLKNNKHCNIHLQHSYNKYGKGVFTASVLECDITTDNLLEQELYWIKLKNSLDKTCGYNLSIPDPINTSFNHSEESKERNRKDIYMRTRDEFIQEDYDKWKLEAKIKKDNVVKVDKSSWVIIEIDKVTGEVVNEYKQLNDITTKYNYSKTNKNKVLEVLSNQRRSYKGFVYVYKIDYDINTDYIVQRPKKYNIK